MKKMYFPSAVICLTILQSCSYNETTDSLEPNWLFWVLVVAFIIILAVAASDNSKTRERILKKKLDKSKFMKSETLLSGHPDVDKSMTNTLVEFRDNNIRIVRVNDYNLFYGDLEMPTFVASIPLDSVSNVIIEDKTQIEKKITAGRLLLVGVFALAWKKKKVMEMQFVNVIWKVGKFENNTIFMFEGSGSLERANSFANSIKKAAS